MNRSRGWCVTINNPTEHDETLAFGCSEVCKYCVFGREVGSECLTPHLQGFLYFETLKSFDQVKLLFEGRAHIERMRGSPQQAADYCKKDGDYFESGTLPMSQQERGEAGKAAIAERWALAKEGRFEELPPEQIKIYEYVRNKYQTVEDRATLENYWIWGPTGKGKSRWARTRHPREDLCVKGPNKWWDLYENQKAVLVEDVAPCHEKELEYSLKIWADHYAFPAEVKGGVRTIRPQIVYVTSQYSIDQVFKEYETQAALFRRFKVVQWNELFGDFLEVN